MFASIFTTLLVKPIFNLLVLIYALIPGHNFGVAIILFTLITRFLMYPLLKKQLYHTKAMRELQPELRRIKKEAAGNKQKESQLTMELYKERQINPVASLGVMLLQIPLFLALFSGLRKIVVDPHAMITFSYDWVRHLSWMRHLATDIKQFDNSFLGIVDLNRSALPKGGGIYLPAMLIVVASSVINYFQIKQTSPNDKESRSLRHILKDANSGKVADTSEVNAAMGRNMAYVFPFLIFILTVSFAAAMSLYFFVGGLVAYLQQAYLLRKDNEQLMGAMKSDIAPGSAKSGAAAGKSSTAKESSVKKEAHAVEAEVVSTPTPKKQTGNSSKKRAHKRKKRKG